MWRPSRRALPSRAAARGRRRCAAVSPRGWHGRRHWPAPAAWRLLSPTAARSRRRTGVRRGGVRGRVSRTRLSAGWWCGWAAVPARRPWRRWRRPGRMTRTWRAWAEGAARAAGLAAGRKKKWREGERGLYFFFVEASCWRGLDGERGVPNLLSTIITFSIRAPPRLRRRGARGLFTTPPPPPPPPSCPPSSAPS